MPDHDALLTLTRNVERCRNTVDLGLLVVLVYRHLNAVRNLLVVVEQHLLADDLRGEEAQCLVGQRILRIVWLTFGQQSEDQVEQAADIEILLGRHRSYPCLGKAFVPPGHQRLERLGSRQVDLVYYHDNRNSALCDMFQHLFRPFAVLDRIGHVKQHVGILQRPAHETHHRLLQLVTGFENPGRIGVDDLEIIAVDNTHDTVARGLCLRGYYRQSFADQRIHQGRLAHIGVAYYVDKTGTVHLIKYKLFKSYKDRQYYRISEPLPAAMPYFSSGNGITDLDLSHRYRLRTARLP